MSTPPRFVRLMGLIVELWLTCLAISLSFLEGLIFVTYEILFSLLGIWASETFRVECSAVLILNAENGVGRNAALKFSELGYTVFALCPKGHTEASVVMGRPRRSLNVSSILYAWHLKKERSPDHPWGLIAPILLDTSSKTDRMHAFETVQAYCADHSLHLIALIVFPPTYEISTESSLSQSTSDFFPAKFLPVSLSKDSVWQESVFREVTEPILITQEYIRLLRRSRGRLIMVTGCSEKRFTSGFGVSSPLDDARRSLAQSLNSELEPLGIRVACVTSGPVSTSALPTQTILDERNICAKKTDNDTIEFLASRLARPNLISNPFWRDLVATREEDLLMVIRRITSSRYPKFDHFVGPSHYIQTAFNTVPTTIFVLVQRWIC